MDTVDIRDAKTNLARLLTRVAAGEIIVISRFVPVLKLTGEVHETAIKLLKASLKSGLISGKIPIGVAFATVYIAAALHSEPSTHTSFSTLQKRLLEHQKDGLFLEHPSFFRLPLNFVWVSEACP